MSSNLISGSTLSFDSTEVNSSFVIIARPNKSTLIAFIIFLGITYTVFGNSLFQVYHQHSSTIHIILILLFGPLSILITLWMIMDYKVVRLEGRSMKVSFPGMGRRITYSLDNLDFWEEVTIKTGKNATYRELLLVFRNQPRIKVARRAYDNYEALARYFQQKFPKQKRR